MTELELTQAALNFVCRDHVDRTYGNQLNILN